LLLLLIKETSKAWKATKNPLDAKTASILEISHIPSIAWKLYKQILLYLL